MVSTLLEVLREEFTHGLADERHLIQSAVRLLSAAVLSAIIGYERERSGKPAGLRTHILVCMGTTVFVLGCSAGGMDADAQSRVVQGIVTGIGFVAGGAILKLSDQRDIQGLTTSAGLWMTSAIGVCIGLGSLGLALLGTVFTLVVLTVMGSLDRRMKKGGKQISPETP